MTRVLGAVVREALDGFGPARTDATVVEAACLLREVRELTLVALIRGLRVLVGALVQQAGPPSQSTTKRIDAA